jgi:hypothetical protein
MIRIFALLSGLAFLAACTTPEKDPTLTPLGEFSLGYNVVVASKMQKGPISRDATEEEWIAALKAAVQNRFGQYDGEQLYHIALSVEGFMLAPPGIPVIYNPRSALIINVTVWDDAAGKKLNEEVNTITVFEDTTSESLILGSGNERTKEEQMAGLSRNAVRKVEKWMGEQNREFGWFERRPDTLPGEDEIATDLPPENPEAVAPVTE